jgi:hypothetical protein
MCTSAVAVSRKSIFDSALELVAEPTVIVLTISKLAEATAAFPAAIGTIVLRDRYPSLRDARR